MHWVEGNGGILCVYVCEWVSVFLKKIAEELPK